MTNFMNGLNRKNMTINYENEERVYILWGKKG